MTDGKSTSPQVNLTAAVMTASGSVVSVVCVAVKTVVPVVTWLVLCGWLASIAAGSMSWWLAVPAGMVGGTAILAGYMAVLGVRTDTELGCISTVLLALLILIIPAVRRAERQAHERRHQTISRPLRADRAHPRQRGIHGE
jgi:hypothetical protein